MVWSLLQLCQESLENVKTWGAAARAAVNAQEANKALGAEVEQVPLTPLPFDQADLKVLLQQSAAGQKALKESFPKKEPRPKALPQAAVKKPQEGKAADAELPPAKRHRGKTPAS